MQMVLRVFLLVIVIIAIVGIVASLMPSAMMMGIFQVMPAPVVTVAYAGEINEIGSLVKDFIKLRENRNSDNAENMAKQLDERINDLGLVQIYCDEKISTLELAFEKNPYQKLQQICPALKDLSLSDAGQLYGKI